MPNPTLHRTGRSRCSHPAGERARYAAFDAVRRICVMAAIGQMTALAATAD